MSPFYKRLARVGITPYPPTADATMDGTFSGEGDFSSFASLRKTLRPAEPRFTNQGGVGVTRNGERSTVFCGRANISVLCTTPVPDWMSVRAWPGKAPQVVVPSTKLAPAQ